MRAFNRQDFIENTRKKYFFDLIQSHIDKSRNISFIAKSLEGTKQFLPDAIKGAFEEFFTELFEISESNSFILMKCADVFLEVESFCKGYFYVTLSDEDIFTIFNIYILTIVSLAVQSDTVKKYLGARYGTFFLTKFLYNMKLKYKNIKRLGAFITARKKGLSEHEAVGFSNELYPPTIADRVYFEKIRLK